MCFTRAEFPLKFSINFSNAFGIAPFIVYIEQFIWR